MCKQLSNPKQQVEAIADHLSHILELLGLDLTENSLAETPLRVAKMYVEELFAGLKPANFPKLTFFDYSSSNREATITVDKVKVHSICEHHLLPFIGHATIRYIPKKKILGLSKIHRLVAHFSQRPQLQEKLTQQIAENLALFLETEDISVTISAYHLCVIMRGIQDQNTLMTTIYETGTFLKREP